MPSESSPVLELRREELQATGTCGDPLPGCGQSPHPTFDSMGPMALPPHVHGVALRPLLRGERGGIAQAIVVRFMWRWQSVSGGYPCSSWV